MAAIEPAGQFCLTGIPRPDSTTIQLQLLASGAVVSRFGEGMHDQSTRSSALTDNRQVTARQPFSVRRAQLAPGDAESRFERCFAEGRRFIEQTAISGLLRSIFADSANRRAVAAVVQAPIHVGFLYPRDEMTLEQMGVACVRAGFDADFSTLPSTVVARELGMLAYCREVPTLIFSAVTNATCAREGYVEAFLPEADRVLTRKWIQDEIASHVGLKLADQTAIRVVHQAFLAEGFEVAPFMGGRPIRNLDAGVSVIYYEKPRSSRTSRIEVLWPLAGTN